MAAADAAKKLVNSQGDAEIMNHWKVSVVHIGQIKLLNNCIFK